MDGEEPKPVGETTLAPVQLSSRQEELCRRLDSLHSLYELSRTPSDMFRGAVFASRPECRTNPDWIAQAANSLREVLYPFYSDRVPKVKDRVKEVLEKFGVVKIDDKTIGRMNSLYERVQGLTHHSETRKLPGYYMNFKPEDFGPLLSEFEEVMLGVLTRNVDLHATVDSVIEAGPPVTVATTV